MRTTLCLSVLCIALTLPAGASSTVDYSQFYEVKATDVLDQSFFDKCGNPPGSCLQNEPLRLLFPPQYNQNGRPEAYTIKNTQGPIVLDMSRALYLHGVNRSGSLLEPANPAFPMFRVQGPAQQHINIAGLTISPDESCTPENGDCPVNYVSFEFAQTTPVQFELFESILDVNQIVIQGPGLYRFQADWFDPDGQVTASILVDHPGADLVLMGGNMRGVGEAACPAPDVDGCQAADPCDCHELYFVWQKQGRVRIFSTSMQLANGEANVRIETASALGEHAVVDVRSEGTTFPSTPARLVTVPPISGAGSDVDIVLKNNQLTADENEARGFVDYNGTGTVWLIGNNARQDVDRVVAGDTGRATVVAVGNSVKGPGLYDVAPRKLIEVGNMRLPTDSDDCAAGGELADTEIELVEGERMPRVPEVDVPSEPLRRPAVTDALPGMVDLGTSTWGCPKGSDDTCRLQRAIDEAVAQGKGLYIPPLTYTTSAPLTLYQAKGVWVAGSPAGTTIHNTAVDDSGSGTVLDVRDVSWGTAQDITFRTTAWASNPSQQASAVRLENQSGVNWVTQGWVFQDCVFDGGRYGLSFGLDDFDDPEGKKYNSDTTLMIGGEYKNAYFGLGTDSSNAMGLAVYDGEFSDNQIAMGQETTGGQWSVYYGTVRNSQVQHLKIQTQPIGVYYFYETSFEQTSLIWKRLGPDPFNHTSNSLTLLFEESEFSFSDDDAGATRLLMESGGAAIFLRSSVPSGRVVIGGALAAAAGIRLYGDFRDWGSNGVSWHGACFPEEPTGVGCFYQVDDLSACPDDVPICGSSDTQDESCLIDLVDDELAFHCPAGHTVRVLDCEAGCVCLNEQTLAEVNGIEVDGRQYICLGTLYTCPLAATPACPAPAEPIEDLLYDECTVGSTTLTCAAGEHVRAANCLQSICMNPSTLASVGGIEYQDVQYWCVDGCPAGHPECVSQLDSGMLSCRRDDGLIQECPMEAETVQRNCDDCQDTYEFFCAEP